MTKLINSVDHALRARASQVIPGGMWGHMSTRYLGEAYPQFFERAEGCRLWDVDGNEYVDLMCSWGPAILGHAPIDVADLVERILHIGKRPKPPRR